MAAAWPLGAATACGRSQFMAICPSSNSTYCGQNRFLAGDHCQWVVVLGRDPELRCRALLQGVDKGERDEELLPDPPDFWRARSEGGCATETFSPGWSSRTRRGRIMAEFAAGGADHCKISVRIRSLGNKKNRPDIWKFTRKESQDRRLHIAKTREEVGNFDNFQKIGFGSHDASESQALTITDLEN